MTPTTFSSDFDRPTPPLMLDAVCVSRRGDPCRAAGRTGTVFGEAGGRAGPARTPRSPAGSPAGSPADLRVVRGRLLDAARSLRGADGR
jgi:hypothetical protein